MYGALCGMAALGRAELSARLLNNVAFREVLELVPEVWRRELADPAGSRLPWLAGSSTAASCTNGRLHCHPTFQINRVWCVCLCVPAGTGGAGRFLRLQLHLLPQPPGQAQVGTSCCWPVQTRWLSEQEHTQLPRPSLLTPILPTTAVPYVHASLPAHPRSAACLPAGPACLWTPTCRTTWLPCTRQCATRRSFRWAHAGAAVPMRMRMCMHEEGLPSTV